VTDELTHNLEVAAAAIKSKLDTYIAVPKQLNSRSEHGR
jgi:hypothetical protein